MGHLYYRCTSKKHRQWHNVLQWSEFHGQTSLTLRQLGTTIFKYLNYEALPPSCTDICTELKVGAKAVQAVVDQLREMGADLGKLENEDGVLCGDVEIDEHGYRSFHMSATNPHYKDVVRPALESKKCSYYLVHLQVIGMRARGGKKLYMKELPLNPVPPNSRPPPLKAEDLEDSGLLDMLAWVLPWCTVMVRRHTHQCLRRILI